MLWSSDGHLYPREVPALSLCSTASSSLHTALNTEHSHWYPDILPSQCLQSWPTSLRPNLPCKPHHPTSQSSLYIEMSDVSNTGFKNCIKSYPQIDEVSVAGLWVGEMFHYNQTLCSRQSSNPWDWELFKIRSNTSKRLVSPEILWSIERRLIIAAPIYQNLPQLSLEGLILSLVSPVSRQSRIQDAVLRTGLLGSPTRCFSLFTPTENNISKQPSAQWN